MQRTPTDAPMDGALSVHVGATLDEQLGDLQVAVAG